MSLPSRILIVSHDASQTGAPVVTLRIGKILKRQGIQVSYALRRGGELTNDFRNISKCFEFSQVPITGSDELAFQTFLNAENPDLVIINTAVPGDIAELVARFAPTARLIAYIHELEETIRLEAGEGRFERVKKYCKSFLAASQQVKDNLVRNHKIGEERISVLPGFVEDRYFTFEESNILRDNLFKEFPQASPDSKVIISCGSASPRKGTDVFLETARVILKNRHDVLFLWIGQGHEPQFMSAVFLDLSLIGLMDKVIFAGPRDDMSQYLGAADLFYLPSREDPFPLVCLEAGAAGVPTVAFERSGGIGNYVENDCGTMVRYRDIEAAVASINEILDSPARRAEMARACVRKIRSRYSEEAIGSVLMKALSL